ncbi:MAG: substrate-binding domain-containing protein [Burkholderiales bacterium]|nr:substrate-binding domain-containing protein [Burkholderiales bacterium]
MSELRVLSAGAVKRGVSKVAAEFERTTANRVSVEFRTAPELRASLAAGARADVLVAPPAVMDELAKSGGLLPGSRGFLGRSRMGVVVHAGAPAPPLRDAAEFCAALRAAGGVVHNKASSGIHAARLLERLGLAQELGARIAVVDSGAAVMEHVAAHPGCVGLAQIPEIMVLADRGCPVKLAAPLPPDIQNETSYEAAALAGAAAGARELAASLASDAAKRVFAATGIN